MEKLAPYSSSLTMFTNDMSTTVQAIMRGRQAVVAVAVDMRHVALLQGLLQ